MKLIRKKALVLAAILVLLLVTVNTIILYYNDYVLAKTSKIKIETERAKFLISEIWNQAVRNVDVGLRGFALTKDKGLLGPYNDGKRDYPIIVKELRDILEYQGYKKQLPVDSIIIGVNGFIQACDKMVGLIEADKMEEFTRVLTTDPGKNTWFIFSRNSAILKGFEEELNNAAVSEYKKANERTLLVQTLLFLIGFPTLLFIIFKILKDQRERLNLFLKLEKNNRDFLFNPGTVLKDINEDEVIDNSIKNFKKATEFISEISSGNFDVKWEEINQENEAFNKNNLAGELLNMREKMKSIKAEDEKRSWVNEGLAKFSDVIREHQQNLQSLSLEVLMFISKYLNAQQGALFVLREDEEKKPYLELSACYAFNKKKHLQKRIELGQGMVGQTFLEGQSAMFTEIPSGYTEITSGLGEATPSCILIVPMKYSEKVEGMIEIACFEPFEPYQIQFLEKLGEITASTLGAVKNSEKVQILLNQFREQTELLKAQEEELRQNMEEMEATQESMRRQEREML